MTVSEVAIERDPFGKPRDPELARAEEEGRLISINRSSPPRAIEEIPDKVGVDEVTQLQAASEGVVVTDANYIEFCGEQFKMGAKIGLMPLLRFAFVSSKGVNAGDMEGLAAMYAMIRDCIDEAEWSRFEDVAIEQKADEEDLLAIVTKTIEVLSARPSQRRSASSAGSPGTSASSKVSSTRPAPEGLTPIR